MKKKTSTSKTQPKTEKPDEIVTPKFTFKKILRIILIIYIILTTCMSCWATLYIISQYIEDNIYTPEPIEKSSEESSPIEKAQNAKSEYDSCIVFETGIDKYSVILSDYSGIGIYCPDDKNYEIFDAGEITDSEISPDGQYIAYVEPIKAYLPSKKVYLSHHLYTLRTKQGIRYNYLDVDEYDPKEYGRYIDPNSRYFFQLTYFDRESSNYYYITDGVLHQHNLQTQTTRTYNLNNINFGGNFIYVYGIVDNTLYFGAKKNGAVDELNNAGRLPLDTLKPEIITDKINYLDTDISVTKDEKYILVTQTSNIGEGDRNGYLTTINIADGSINEFTNIQYTYYNEYNGQDKEIVPYSLESGHDLVVYEYRNEKSDKRISEIYRFMAGHLEQIATIDEPGIYLEQSTDDLSTILYYTHNYSLGTETGMSGRYGAFYELDTKTNNTSIANGLVIDESKYKDIRVIGLIDE